MALLAMSLGGWLFFWSASIPDGPRIEAELSGRGAGYTDISSDVKQVPAPLLTYGIGGAGPLDLVAKTGVYQFALKNNASNSGGLLGYYSPENANSRPGWRLGIGIRFTYRHLGVDFYKFVGTLDTVAPSAGKFLDRVVLCSAVDWIDEAARFRPIVATQVDQRLDQVVAALVAAVPRQPEATSYDTGDSTFLFALDNSESDRQPVLTELQKGAQSEYSKIVIRGDTVTGGVLRVYKRTAALTPSVVASFDDTMVGLQAVQDRLTLVNSCLATAHPRRVDAAATSILFTLQGTPSVAPGASLTINGLFNDPTNRANRVGGKDMVTPVATTDYTTNANADGSGADLTANFTVVATFGANRVKLVVTNNGGASGFITKLQTRGRGLYDYDPIEAPDSDATSITNYGENQIPLEMPYQSDPNTAFSVADFIVSRWSSPAAMEVVMTLFPANDAAMLTSALSIEPGDAISVRETVTGIMHTYWVQAVLLRVEPGDLVRAEYLLQRAVAADSWTLGVVGLSEMGQTTIMAPL